MRTIKLFLLIAALCTAVPSLMGQVPVNVDPNQSAGLQKFFLVPESVLAQIPHQNKIIPIPQNVVSSPPATGAGQSSFNSVQNSHQNPNRAALTPDQAQQAKAQEAFRNQVIESNRKAIAQRQEPIAASNQFSQNDQFSNNQQQDFQQHSQQQVHPQTQVHTQQVQTPTPAKRVVKPQRQKNVQRPIEQGVNQVSQQQQFQQPRVHHQQSQHQFQQPQVQQVQQPQVQQQQFAPSPQFQQPQQASVQTQPSAAVQRHQHDQVQQHPTSFLSNQPSAESQRRPFDTRSQPIRDEDEIIRQQAENAKYSFSSSVTDGINDQQHIRQETRDGLKLSGLYSYSDGFYKRTIHYEADENGYRVTNEESEPIGNGPNSDPSGVAEVASDVGGASVRYSITGQDFPRSVFTGNEPDSSNNFQRI